MQEHLKCPICWNIAKHPYESSCCGHIFCQKCTNDIIICPICKSKDFNFVKNVFAENLLFSLKLDCEANCGEKISYDKYENHQYFCKKRSILCNFSNCNFSAPRSKFIEHVKTKHSKELLFKIDQEISTEDIEEKLEVIKRMKELNVDDEIFKRDESDESDSFY